jgi:hypothetical protein
VWSVRIEVHAKTGTKIDLSESHVDVPDLDLVLPHNAAGLDPGVHDIASQGAVCPGA